MPGRERLDEVLGPRHNLAEHGVPVKLPEHRLVGRVDRETAVDHREQVAGRQQARVRAGLDGGQGCLNRGEALAPKSSGWSGTTT